jgi:hypothetical protein
MMISVIGIGFGVTFTGVLVDWLLANNIDSPYTKSLLFCTGISFLTIPLFFFAGRNFDRDRQALKEWV